MGDLPNHQEISEVPFFPQDDYQCGPAALATMLKYRGIAVTPDDLVPALYIPEKKGSLAIEVNAQARRYKMLSYPIEPRIADLLREVANGNPVLVFQNLGLSWWPQYHFAVAVGYDLADDVLILRSGRRSSLRTALRTFENTWARTGHWARVIVSPGSIPATARAIPYLQAVSDLEQTGHDDAAEAGYEAALARWGQQTDAFVMANLGLANIAYAHGDYVRSDLLLRANIESNPLSTDSWNNLSYVLVARHCASEALSAVQCAIALDPDDPNVGDSVRDIVARTSGITEDSQARCQVPSCPV